MLLGAQNVLVVGPDSAKKVRSVQDLRGAIVGVAAYGGPSQHTANWILSRHGLSPSDVTIVPIGTMATAVAAVEHSKVAAAFMNEVEYLMLQKRGVNVHVLVDLRGRENSKRIHGMEDPTTVLMAKERWLREHSETARSDLLARSTGRCSGCTSGRQRPCSTRYPHDIAVTGTSISQRYRLFCPCSRKTITPAEGVEAVKRVLSISVESLRTGNLDLSKTYTNEFVAGR
jgi:NitT/TauT family transport system substrate-binding protein